MQEILKNISNNEELVAKLITDKLYCQDFLEKLYKNYQL